MLRWDHATVIFPLYYYTGLRVKSGSLFGRAENEIWICMREGEGEREGGNHKIAVKFCR